MSAPATPDSIHTRTEPAGEDAPRLGASLDAAEDGPGHLADGTRVELVRGPDGAPLEYRIGASFVLRRTERLPELPAPRDAEPLRLDDHFLAQLARAEQQHPGGAVLARCSDSHG